VVPEGRNRVSASTWTPARCRGAGRRTQCPRWPARVVRMYRPNATQSRPSTGNRS